MSDGVSIYLDHNATTPPYPEVVEAVTRCLRDGWGNPSSAHSIGSRATLTLERARDHVSKLMGCDADRIVFTSGATESCNHVIANAHPIGVSAPALAISAIEHAAVMSATEREERNGRRVVIIPVDSNGVLSLDALETALLSGVRLVSIQWANSELGTIQPVTEAIALARRYGALIHLDACQSLGREPMCLDSLDPDFVSVSGHKIGAPPGIGALYIRDRKTLASLAVGGDQEKRRRAGTENLSGAVGFGEAARIRHEAIGSLSAQWHVIRSEFESRVMKFGHVNAVGAPRVANTTSLTIPAIDGAALVARLDRIGVQVSLGSACHSSRPEPSHVLRAIGMTEGDAYSTIRVSLGWNTTREEVLCTPSRIESLITNALVTN